MAIAFPKLHIAESVLNRISNTLEEQGPLGMSTKRPAPPIMQEPPMIPNPEPVGSAINHNLNQPPMQVAVPPEMQESAELGMVENVATGGSAFNGALIGASS